jgi:antitoxin CptB
MIDEQAAHRRVYWHSRRGMRELDLLLMPFAEQVYPGLDPLLQAAYRRLLAEEDTDIFGWIVNGARLPDPELAPIVERIVAYGRAPALFSDPAF